MRPHRGRRKVGNVKKGIASSIVALVLVAASSAPADNVNKALADTQAAQAALTRARADEARAHADYNAAMHAMAKARRDSAAAAAQETKATAAAAAAQKDQRLAGD